MPITIPNLDYLRKKDQKLAEAIVALTNSITNLERGTTVSANPKLATLPPPQVTSFIVTAADGIFQGTIVDTGNVRKGVEYFAEYDIDLNFTQPHVIHIGTARTFRMGLGNLSLYWRAYSQYQGSPPSIPVNFGNPTAVIGGGANGPALPGSTGSGTASQNGQQGGQGYGIAQVREQ
jgi:hypothetical protein